MATRFRVRRRATGAPGAPATALSGEISYNEVDGYGWIGFGDDGAGNATSVKAIFKDDFNVQMRLPAGGGTGQILTKSSSADYAVAWSAPAAQVTYTNGTGLTLVGGVFAADLTVLAKLDSPAFINTPTAPTQAGADNSTKLATTAFVQARLVAMTNGASAAYDTFKELQDFIVNDESTAAALAIAVAGKAQKDQNLADLGNIATARTNLGLSSMAQQAANNVAITGGSIDGVVLDGGTF